MIGYCSRPFDQVDLPRARPAFQRFLTLDRILDVGELLHPHQPGGTVSPGETSRLAHAVLDHAMMNVVGHTDVQRAMGSARQDVHVVNVLCGHGGVSQDRLVLASRWVLGSFALGKCLGLGPG